MASKLRFIMPKFFSFSESRYFLVTGIGKDSEKIEVINTNGSVDTCGEPWEKMYPKDVSMATGDILTNKVVICGGAPYTKACFALAENLRWNQLAELKIARSGSAGIVIQDYLWVTGGYNEQADGNTILKTTEKVRT